MTKGGTTSDRFCRALRAREIDGGQGRNRTTDTRIFSPLLYRLSYLATLLHKNESRRGICILTTPSSVSLLRATDTRILVSAGPRGP